MSNSNRTLVVGDIHGNYLGLIQALERAGFNPNVDLLISLGDLVDGYPDSYKVVDYFIQLNETASIKPIFIRGNHDQWFQEFLEDGFVKHIWKSQGGEATLESYSSHPKEWEKHLKFFKNQIDYYIDSKNRGFVHGGFTSKQGLGYEMHNSVYYWDRDLWNLAVMQHTSTIDASEVVLKQSTRFLRHTEVFIGHTTTMQWIAKGHFHESKDPNQILNGKITVPMNRCNVWNLDTGGGYNGKITVMDVTTKEYFQSDLAKELYSEHSGR